MEKMLKAFGRWRLNEPPTRHKLLVNSSHRYAHENALFLILSWDYVLNPTDRKIACLRDVFIRARGDLFVNIPGPVRSASLAILDTGTAPVGGLAALMSLGAGPATRLRGPVTLAAPSGRGRALGATARPTAPSGAARAGGLSAGGAGNYNIATKALIAPVSDVSVLLADAVGSPADFHAGPKVAADFSPRLVEDLPNIRKQWDGDLDRLL